MALSMLSVARPPDEDHAYGHAKAEYPLPEGLLILVAASIGGRPQRLVTPRSLEQIGVGLAVSAGRGYHPGAWPWCPARRQTQPPITPFEPTHSTC